MKETIGFYSQIQDSQLSVDSACRRCREQLASRGQGLALFLRTHIASGLAAGIIGILWYTAIVLFLQQLAEYGW